MTREEWLRQEIATFRSKIATYEAFIAEYEQQLGMSPATAAGGNVKSGGAKPAGGDTDLAAIPSMVWFNKSQPEAAKQLLERIGYPLRTHQIVEGIERGGVTVGGKDANAKKYNLYTILGRSDDFVRVKRDTWALTTWPGVPKKSVDDNGDNEAEAKKPTDKDKK